MLDTENPQTLGFDLARLQRIKRWVDRYVTQKKFAGSALQIARKGKTVFSYEAGLRSIEDQRPFSRDSLCRIYSMTKPITSVAIMMLIERGLFHLDVPISEFIPAFGNAQVLKTGATKIDQVEPTTIPTVHQLLTHTSGMTYPFNDGVLSREMKKEKIFFGPEYADIDNVIARLSKLPLDFTPGTRWEYSVSIDVLGRIVEIASGMSLDEFFEKEIFEPLSMKETGFRVETGSLSRFASLYTPLDGDALELNAKPSGKNSLRLADNAKDSAFLNPQMFAGGAGLVSTIEDYMKFSEMLRCGGIFQNARLLSPKTVDFMMANHLEADIPRIGPKNFAGQSMAGMGFGLGGAVMLDAARAGNAGSVGDFSWGGIGSTFFWVDRKLEMSVVFLTQLSPTSVYPSRGELRSLVQGAIIE